MTMHQNLVKMLYPNGLSVCPQNRLKPKARQALAVTMRENAVTLRRMGDLETAFFWEEQAYQTERGFAVWWRIDGGSLLSLLGES